MILDSFRLDGKVAIVTGAGRGIGATIAQAFGEVGAKVVCAARTSGEIEAVAEHIRSTGQEACAIACDITREEDIAGLVRDTVARYGRIDIVINNAAAGGLAGGHGSTAEINDERMISTFRVNFLAAVNVSRAAIPHMTMPPGSIVNISSGYARVANIGSLLHGCAKAALEQATRMMAMEFAPGVRINAIRVGAVQSEAMQKEFLAAYPGIGEKLAAWTPVGRLGETRDIALAALYLASPASAYVTGKILDVEGGMVVERSVVDIIERSERLQREGAASGPGGHQRLLVPAREVPCHRHPRARQPHARMLTVYTTYDLMNFAAGCCAGSDRHGRAACRRTERRPRVHDGDQERRWELQTKCAPPWKRHSRRANSRS